MEKRKVNEKDFKRISEKIKGANTVLLITNNGSSLFGETTDILGAYAELTHKIFENTNLDKGMLLEACKLGLDMDSMFSKASKDEFEKDMEDLDKEIDKKLETIEKLVDILKDLRKGDK